MAAFVLRRMAQAVIVLMAVGLLAFLMFRYVGDPVDQMVGIETSLAERAALRERLGLNDPPAVQYWRFVSNAARFEFGLSYRFRQPVSQMILERLPATLELSICSALLALAIGLPMGVYTGIRRSGFLSRLILAGSLVGISLPTFLIGILLIYIFAVQWHLLPSFGRGDTVDIGGWSTGLLTVSGLKALVLPSITLGLFQMALIVRLVRSEMLEVMRTDFIRFARARGLSDRAVHFGHALKNTLVPVVTVMGLQLGSVIAFAIITETVFQWPGMGLLFLQAVQNADIPIMAAYLMLIAFVFVAINLAVDLIYMLLDPRLRIAGSRN
ncbi:MAG TPA: ABC transporter permease [Afifellaceae bacterium]|nr:ABC transporter permease [Afifellaceae bacterium]